jgi:hypothetical protein
VNKTEKRDIKRKVFESTVFVSLAEKSGKDSTFNRAFAWGLEEALKIGGVSDNERWDVVMSAQDWTDKNCPGMWTGNFTCQPNCDECQAAARKQIT